MDVRVGCQSQSCGIASGVMWTAQVCRPVLGRSRSSCRWPRVQCAAAFAVSVACIVLLRTADADFPIPRDPWLPAPRTIPPSAHARRTGSTPAYTCHPSGTVWHALQVGRRGTTTHEETPRQSAPCLGPAQSRPRCLRQWYYAGPNTARAEEQQHGVGGHAPSLLALSAS